MKRKLLISIVLLIIMLGSVNVLRARSAGTTTVTVTCGDTQKTYTGDVIEICSATFTNSDGGSGSLPVTYSPDPPIDVGTVTATATYVADANYDGSSDSKSYDIVAAQAHVSVNCPTVSYTGASQQVCTAVVTGPLLSQNVPVNYSGDTTNAGTYTASATWAPTSNNYLGDTNTATGKITQATGTVTLTCSAGPFTYNGTAQTPCSSAQVAYSDSSVVDLTSAITYSANTNAGTATAKASYDGDSNHAKSSGSINFTIAQAAANCNVVGYGVPYDVKAHTATGSCTGVNGETPPLNLTGTTHTDAGSWNDPWNVNDPNYTGSGTVADLITKVDANCSFPDYTKTYDGNAYGPVGSCTSSADSSVILPTLVNPAVVIHYPGGDAPWTLTNSSVNGSPVTGSTHITILKAPSYVTLNCPDQTYDGLAQTPCTASVTGAGSFDPTVAITITYLGDNKDAGTVSASAAYPGDNDHDPDTVNNTFKINQAKADCSSIAAYNVTYDGQFHLDQGACYPLAIDGTDPLAGLDLSGSSQKNAGSYPFDWTLVGNNNYKGSGSLTNVIQKAKATCDITPYKITYDGAEHVATGHCDGIVGESNLTGLDLSHTDHLTANDWKTDTWSFASPNYESQNQTIDDIIYQAYANCHILGYSGIYDGHAHGLSGSCTGVNNETPAVDLGKTFTNVPGGSTDWSVTDKNYSPEGGTLPVTITPYTATCAVTPYHVFYDGNPHTAPGSCTGVNGESPALNLDGTTHTNANTYNDTWILTDPNYILVSGLSTGSITDIIDPANASCNFGPDYSVTYDGLTHGATGSCTTAGGGATTGLVVDPPGGPAVGSYHITWSFSNPNYHITNASSGFVNVTINKRNASVSAVAASKTYGAPDPALTTTPGNFVAADLSSITFGATRASGETVAGSPYLITPSLVTGAPVANYNITYNNANFTITKATAACTITPYNDDYTGSPQTATGTCLGVLSDTLNGLDLSHTSHTLPGDYASDYWKFTDGTGNYYSTINVNIHDHINFLQATNCTVPGYIVVYDGSLHRSTYSCDQAGTLNNGTDHTIAGSWNDTWFFTSTDGIYQATGLAYDVINPAPTTTTVTCTPTSIPYDGNAHLPCSARTQGAGGLNTLTPLTLASQYTATTPPTNTSPPTNAGTYTASFTYIPTSGNFTTSTGSGTFDITQVPSITTITCNPTSIPYTGSPITPCSATVTGAGGLSQAVTVTYTNNTAIGTASASANFLGDTNHTPSSASATFQITQVVMNCHVTAYTITYDGNAHTAAGTCVTSDGKDFTSGLNLGNTTHTNAGTYNNDSWTFTDSTGVWPNQNGTLTDSIARADATCDGSFFSFYNGPYTGTPHGGAGKCTGVKGEDLSSLITYTSIFGGGSYLNASSSPLLLSWYFNNGYPNPNYNTQNGYGYVTITPANSATAVHCTITGWSGLYDGLSHGATIGACTGVNNEDLTGSVTLGNPSSFINVGVWPVAWMLSNSNYTPLNGSVNITITLIQTVTTVTCPVSVTYTGNSQTPCTAMVTGGGLNQSLPVTYSADTTNAGTVTASASYPGDTNHAPSNGSATFKITPVIATCNVTGYSLPYDGKPHTAGGTCTGMKGEDLSAGLNLVGTTHTEAGSWNDSWFFTSSSGNYNNITGQTVSDSISKVDPTCTVTGYNKIYDGNPHTATGSCVGIDGVTPIAGLVLTGTTHTDVGSWNDSWSFTSTAGDYNSVSGKTVADAITAADATCTISANYTVPYDGNPHGATGSCKSSSGKDLSASLNLGASFTYVPGGSASWTFNDADYKPLNGTVNITITPKAATVNAVAASKNYGSLDPTLTTTNSGFLAADLPSILFSATRAPGESVTGSPYLITPSAVGTALKNYSVTYKTANFTIIGVTSSVTVSCTPSSVAYNGQAQTPCKASYTTADGLTGPLTPTYTANIYPGTVTASATYPGDVNHNSSTNSATFVISKATATCTVAPGYNGPYDGQAHGAVVTCTGVPGEDLSTSLSLGDSFTDAPGGTATWSFTNANYVSQGGSVIITITKTAATCTVTAYNVPYDGNAHMASGTCYGIDGVTPITGLDLTGTVHTAVGVYPNDAWSFINIDYTNPGGNISDTITRYTVTCTVHPYTVSFDGDAHSATGSCIGSGGTTVTGLDLSATTHTYPGDYTGDAWTFTDTTGNYANTSGTVDDSITKANPTCTITPYAVPYDGMVHIATGACTGAHGATLDGLVLTGTTHTDAGDYPGDAWTFTNPSGNYNDANGTVHDSIARINATCTITPYSVDYNGNPHTATGYCVIVGSVTVTGLDLSGTTHTDGGDYPDDAWTFTAPSGNYNTTTGTVHNYIAKVDATCSVSGYSLTYDGSAHTASGSCSGLGGVNVDGLDLGGTTHTDAGDYPDDNWGLKNTNYTASGTVHDIINKTNATCSVTGYSGVYDGLSHGASGTCTSASGMKLPGLNLGRVFKDAPGGSAGWNFINSNVSNAPQTGSVDITLSQAPSLVTMTCPASAPYSGSALEPCTAAASGPGGFTQNLTVSYTDNTDIGTATASASFVGDINHTGSSGSITFYITPVTLAGAPLVGGEGSSVAKNLKGESGAGLDEKSALLAALVTDTPASTALPTSTKEVAKSGLGSDGKAQNSSSKSKSSNFWSTYSGLFGCIGSVFLAMLIFFMFKRRKDEETEENGAGNGTGTGSDNG